MYCGQCGKKVMDNMLFCPFCGSPIVIPEQDEPAVKPSAEPVFEAADEKPVQPEIEAADARPASLFDEMYAGLEAEEKAEPEEEFVPLSFDFDAIAEEETEAVEPPTEAEIMDVAPDPVPAQPVEDVPPEPQRRPVRPNAADTRRPEARRPVKANTYIPVKDIDPDDMFMDAPDEYDAEDGYDVDEYDAQPPRRRYRDEIEDDFDYEEPEHGSFFQRHIRGIVCLILLLIVALVCLVWAVSPKGQLSLARMNLAWTAQPYADLGYEAYQQNSDLMAARYYEKAYNREPDNYEYAHSAMVAYYEADETESAATMLKKCIEMAPDNPEPYQEMLILYPDASKRPWEVTELVRQGYERTGNEALKVD